MKIDEVIKNLVKAFPEEDFPEKANLLYYKNCQHDECLYLRKVFGKRTWSAISVPDGDIRYRDDVIHFFSSKALYYYLPTFFVYIVSNYEEADVLVDHLLNLILLKLQKDSVQYDPEFSYEFFRSKEKIIAIKKFLKFLITSYNDNDAMDLYVHLSQNETGSG